MDIYLSHRLAYYESTFQTEVGKTRKFPTNGTKHGFDRCRSDIAIVSCCQKYFEFPLIFVDDVKQIKLESIYDEQLK